MTVLEMLLTDFPPKSRQGLPNQWHREDGNWRRTRRICAKVHGCMRSTSSSQVEAFRGRYFLYCRLPSAYGHGEVRRPDDGKVCVAPGRLFDEALGCGQCFSTTGRFRVAPEALPAIHSAHRMRDPKSASLWLGDFERNVPMVGLRWRNRALRRGGFWDPGVLPAPQERGSMR